MTGKEARVGRPRRRRITYCVVPPDLALGLHDPLRRHFRDDPDVEVVVERRRRDRRSGRDRRRVPGQPPGGLERRRVKSLSGRRIGERRATLVPLERAPAVPEVARRHADRIAFVERLEPSTRETEDRDAARLVARFQGGDREAFAVLYSRYFDRVYGYLRVILRDAHEAEDAAQQVFVKLLEALPAYERRRQPFRAWFLTVVRNVAFDCLRRRSRIEPQEAGRLDLALQRREGSELDPEALWIADRDLAGLLETLSLPQRQVVLLRYMLGLSSDEAGRVLARSPVAVRSLQYRALRSLRKRLGGRAPSVMPAARSRLPVSAR